MFVLKKRLCPPNCVIATSKDTRVLVDDFSNNIAMDLFVKEFAYSFDPWGFLIFRVKSTIDCNSDPMSFIEIKSLFDSTFNMRSLLMKYITRVKNFLLIKFLKLKI